MPKTSSKSAKKARHAELVEAARYRKWVLAAMQLTAGLAGVIMLSVAASLHTRAWLLEGIASYAPQVMIAGWLFIFIYMIVATWYGIVRGWRWLLGKLGPIGIASLLIFAGSGLYSYLQSVTIVEANGIVNELTDTDDRLRIGTFNKLLTSVNFATDIAALAETKVDILVLQEVQPVEVSIAKGALNLSFSYITECNCSAGTSEVAILSRYPITNAITLYEHPNSATTRAVIESSEHGRLVVYGVHMHVPYAQSSYALREGVYESLSADIRAETDPVFVAGDFNTTVFAPDMSRFINKQTNIVNAAARGWPHCSWYGFGSILCARIDHVFVPSTAELHAVSIGNEIYSDHRSVVAEVTLESN